MLHGLTNGQKNEVVSGTWIRAQISIYLKNWQHNYGVTDHSMKSMTETLQFLAQSWYYVNITVNPTLILVIHNAIGLVHVTFDRI
jgi:hypothetical protein